MRLLNIIKKKARLENKLISQTADAFGLTSQELKGRKRTAEIVTARQVAMYLLRMNTGKSLKEVGDLLGGRTPATVSYGFQLIALKLQTNSWLRHHIQQLEGKRE